MLLIFTVVAPVSAKTTSFEIEILEDTSSKEGDIGSIQVTLNANKYQIKNSDLNHFDIEMEGFGSSLIPGKPILPYKIFYVGLPPGAEVESVEIICKKTEKIPGQYNIRLSSQPIGDIANDVNDEINIDAKFLKEPYPSKIFEYKGMSQLRKYKLAVIGFYPFILDPSTNQLVLNKQITLDINYKIVENEDKVTLADTAMDDLAKELIVNYDDIAQFYYATPLNTKTLQSHDYVIITSTLLQPFVSNFVTWKQSIGHSVNVVTLSWITSNYPASDTQKSIRDFLKANYISWGITHVLIVGSHSSIPMRTCWPDPTAHTADGVHDIPTDYYYADLTGFWDSDGDGFYGERGQDSVDFTPEVYVGRIPIDTGNTVQNILAKIKSFEQTPYSGWKKNALLLGAIYTFNNEDHNANNVWWDGAEVMEKCRTNLLTGFSCTTMYEKSGIAQCPYACSSPLTNANVLSNWGSTNGWGIVNWAAHGSATSATRKVWSWDDGDGVPETYVTGEITYPNIIQNTDNTNLYNSKPPIVFGASCNCARPETWNNLGASLLVQGASAFVGATRISYGSIGWTQPSHGGHGTICYDFTNRIANQAQDCGRALYNAKQYVYNNFPWNLWQDNANMYNFNLYGDPSMGMTQQTANNPPNTPSQPSGPTSGNTGSSYSYTTSTTDPDNDNVKYGWDWDGDSVVDQWTGFYSSGAVVSTSHTWNSPGTYNVKVKAEDINGAQSVFSTFLTVVITTSTNNPPNTPSQPSGPTSGTTGVQYTYTTNTTDPDNDNVKYGWDDGDNIVNIWSNFYPSGADCTIGITFFAAGTYTIQVKAEDAHGAQSGFSPHLTVVITGSNNAPQIPSMPSGPSSGTTGVSYSYSTSTTDPDNDNVKYGWDWDGDNVIDEWTSFTTSGTVVSTSHLWSSAGTYNVKVKAEDINGAQSTFSTAKTVVISSGVNNPPNTPAKPSGKLNGKAGMAYMYTSISTDPDGDQIHYWFDWGDGTNSGWQGPLSSGTAISANHTWNSKGNYQIKVKCKDIHGAESNWSATLSISMPKPKNILNPLFTRLMQLFQPILSVILQLLGISKFY